MFIKASKLTIAIALTGIILMVTGCGKKTPSSRLHCTAAADCEAIAYCDATEVIALLRDVYQIFPENNIIVQDVKKDLTRTFRGIDKVNLDDLVDGYRAIAPKVFVSFDSTHKALTRHDFDEMRLAIQLKKDLPVYKLYKAFAPVVMDNMPVKASMPSTGENILLIGSDGMRSKMETALEQKGKDTFPDDLLEGIPQESICYAALRLKDLLSMIKADEKMNVLGNDLNSVVRDARMMNFAAVRDGKRQVMCYVNVFYEDKKVAKEHLAVVKKTLKDISKEMSKGDNSIRDIVKKISVSRAGKALSLKCILNIPTQKVMEKILGRAEEKKLSIECMLNIKQLTLAMSMYSDDNKMAFPPQQDLEKTLSRYVRSSKTFQCPVAQKNYRYFLGEKSASEIRDKSKSFNLVCEHEHEKGKLQVGFVDGHIETVDKSKVEKAIKNCAAGKLPCLD